MVHPTREKGVTLIELLVVLVIVGILGAVTLRAMDATRERANYDKTMKGLQRLSNAITGDPTLVSEGRRTDFGFVGDLGRLPVSLEELRENTQSNSAWNGPYVRVPFEGDQTSFRTDAWGQELTYLSDQGTITSLANGRFPLTYRLEDTAFLFRNQVSGTITDNLGNPPGNLAPTMHVHLWVADPDNGQPVHYDTTPAADGSYIFPSTQFRIPAGNHQMTVVRAVGAGESLTKWVTVTPRVGAIVDFRWGQTLIGALQLVNGSVRAQGPDTNWLYFELINTGSDTVRIDTVAFAGSDTAYCDTVWFNGNLKWYYPGGIPNNRIGVNDTFGFVGGPEPVPSMQRVRVDMKRFYRERTGPGTPVPLVGKSFKFRFDDGSYISFVVH